MYESFFGLTGKPFQLNPDPSFYFNSREHRRAMAYLEYGLHQNEGFIVITGEIGAGKTTLLRSLLKKLDPHQVVAAQLVSTQLDAEDTLRMVCAAFGLPASDISKSDALLSLEKLLISLARQGKRALLIVDESQNLTPRAVEELRMLSNFQIGTHALIQSFLVGQPEFRQTMCSPEMQQLRQRIIASCHIGPMSVDETQAYIEHRLNHVGWSGNPRFESGAYEAIYRFTGGVPRRINTLCDRLMLSAFLGNKQEILTDDVVSVAEELTQETFSSREGPADMAPLNGSLQASSSTGGSSLAANDISVETPRSLTRDASVYSNPVQEQLTRLEHNSEATLEVMKQILEVLRTKQPDKTAEK